MFNVYIFILCKVAQIVREQLPHAEWPHAFVVSCDKHAECFVRCHRSNLEIDQVLPLVYNGSMLLKCVHQRLSFRAKSQKAAEWQGKEQKMPAE